MTQAVSNRYQNTVTRSYNDDSTLASEGLITNSQNYQISHQYDSAHRETSITYPNGKVINKVYTSRSQLSSIAYDNSIVANFTYDAGKRETARGLGNGLTQITNYNLDNTIQQKTVAGVTNYSYTYDANKRKLTETDAVNTNLSQTFAYDFENRLTSWSSNGTTLNQSQSWALSLEGAWNSNTINGNTETRTFNSVYETLTSNSNPMLHDRRGNLTKNKDGSLYTWDFENEARKAKFGSLDPIQLKNRYGQVHGCTQHNQLSFSIAGTPSVNASYAYDALGRRVSKTANNSTTIYVSTGYQIATEYKSVNNSVFTESQSYVYATYIDDPLVLINATGKFYYHSNQQFSVSKLTDSNQNIIESYAYNAYGDLKILIDSNAVDNTYFFTGRQLDSETGLFYFRARYYDAKLGQFISRDPIGYVDGMNLYRGYFAVNGIDAFGLNDPLNMFGSSGDIDFSGTKAKGAAEAGEQLVNLFKKNTLDISQTQTFHIDFSATFNTLVTRKPGLWQTDRWTITTYYWDSATCTCWEYKDNWYKTYRDIQVITVETMTAESFDIIARFSGQVSNSTANQLANNVNTANSLTPGMIGSAIDIASQFTQMLTSGLDLTNITFNVSIANRISNTSVISADVTSETEIQSTGHTVSETKTNKLKSECVNSTSN